MFGLVRGKKLRLYNEYKNAIFQKERGEEIKRTPVIEEINLGIKVFDKYIVYLLTSAGENNIENILDEIMTVQDYQKSLKFFRSYILINQVFDRMHLFLMKEISEKIYEVEQKLGITYETTETTFEEMEEPDIIYEIEINRNNRDNLRSAKSFLELSQLE